VDNYGLVEIEFTDEYSGSRTDHIIWPLRKLKINTTWEKISGIWYCRNAGALRNISLNGDMVMSNDQRPIEEILGIINKEQIKEGSTIRAHPRPIVETLVIINNKQIDVGSTIPAH